MEKELEQFRQEVERLRAGRQRGSLTYPETPLIETARLRGEDPGHYLKRAALAAIENPGTLTLPKSQN
jgi:hypothetical protein